MLPVFLAKAACLICGSYSTLCTLYDEEYLTHVIKEKEKQLQNIGTGQAVLTGLKDAAYNLIPKYDDVNNGDNNNNNRFPPDTNVESSLIAKLESPKTNKSIAKSQRWLAFWITLATFECFESVFDSLLFWLPLYGEVKFTFLVYLCCTQTTGTTPLFRSMINPVFAKIRINILKYVISIREVLINNGIISNSSKSNDDNNGNITTDDNSSSTTTKIVTNTASTIYSTATDYIVPAISQYITTSTKRNINNDDNEVLLREINKLSNSNSPTKVKPFITGVHANSMPNPPPNNNIPNNTNNSFSPLSFNQQIPNTKTPPPVARKPVKQPISRTSTPSPQQPSPVSLSNGNNLNTNSSSSSSPIKPNINKNLMKEKVLTTIESELTLDKIIKENTKEIENVINEQKVKNTKLKDDGESDEFVIL